MRNARPADAPRLAELSGTTDSRVAQEKFLQYCENARRTTGIVLVAEIAGEVCGFVLYTLVLDEASINDIAVDPACRGRGYGRELLQQALALVQKAGARRCLLEVRASNSVALALYESEGFALDGKRPGYYSSGSGVREDALLMSRRL